MANAAQRIQMTLEKYDEIEENECRIAAYSYTIAAHTFMCVGMGERIFVLSLEWFACR